MLYWALIFALDPLKQLNAHLNNAKEDFTSDPWHSFSMCCSVFLMAIISASRLWYLRHSLPIPPVVVNTKGPKCCMLNVENSSWIQTFFSRSHAYGCCGSRPLYDSVFGWQTLTSKTADRWFSQNPHAWISNLASCTSVDPLSYSTVSPEMTGSVSTSLLAKRGSKRRARWVF